MRKQNENAYTLPDAYEGLCFLMQDVLSDNILKKRGMDFEYAKSKTALFYDEFKPNILRFYTFLLCVKRLGIVLPRDVRVLLFDQAKENYSDMIAVSIDNLSVRVLEK
jgi:hypothetical protein